MRNLSLVLLLFVLQLSLVLGLPAAIRDGEEEEDNSILLEDSMALRICEALQQNDTSFEELLGDLEHISGALLPEHFSEIRELVDSIFANWENVRFACSADRVVETLLHGHPFLSPESLGDDSKVPNFETVPKNEITGTPMPVILVPGLTTPQLEVKLDMKTAPHFYCTKHTGHRWVLLWMANSAILPGLRDCWVSRVVMSYDATAQTFVNQPGVEIRTIDFGNVKSVYQWSFLGKPVPIYEYFINNLTANGWVADESIRVAQYDLRLDANTLEKNGYYEQVKDLIEETYEHNNQTQVHMLGHSMGSYLSHRFLLAMDQEWKDKYIASFIGLCGPYAGSGAAVGAMIFGYSSQKHGIGFPAAEVAAVTRNISTVASLFPDAQMYNASDILMQLPDRNYTFAQINDFFNEYGFSQLANYRAYTAVDHKLAAPNVTVHCLNGYNMPTPMGYQWLDMKNSTPTGYFVKDGDTIVSRESLNVCQGWASQQSKPVTSVEVEFLTHGAGLFIQPTIDYVMNLMRKP